MHGVPLPDLLALEALALDLARVDGPAAAARALLALALPEGGCGVVLAGPEGAAWPVLASTGLPAETLPRSLRPADAPAVEAAVRTGRPAQGTLGTAWDALAPLRPAPAPVLVLPLRADGRTSGALLLLTPPLRALPVLERAAEHAALALRTAWRLEQVSRLAATDGLTKIANRRTFETTLDREVARSVRSGEPLSLVLLDLDHFKRLNDSLGHQAGDEVLRNAAFALTCECRDFDTPARYGGEEFAVVLPGCGPGEAAEAAERLRRAVASAPAPQGAVVTASAGVATFPGHAQVAAGLVRAADQALYRAKDAGRDRSAVSDGPAAGTDPEQLLRQAVLARLAATGPGPGAAATGRGVAGLPDAPAG